MPLIQTMRMNHQSVVALLRKELPHIGPEADKAAHADT